jgi:hypothetical protein
MQTLHHLPWLSPPIMQASATSGMLIGEYAKYPQ